jgi:hypothetical protein
LWGQIVQIAINWHVFWHRKLQPHSLCSASQSANKFTEIDKLLIHVVCLVK